MCSCVLQAIKARSEAEQKRKEKKAAMARPTRANSNPNMDPKTAHGTQQRSQGMPHLLCCCLRRSMGCFSCCVCCLMSDESVLLHVLELYATPGRKLRTTCTLTAASERSLAEAAGNLSIGPNINYVHHDARWTVNANFTSTLDAIYMQEIQDKSCLVHN